MVKKKDEPLEAIEELKKRLKVSNAVFVGIKISAGWISGKQVTESEFMQVKEAFLLQNTDGREGARG